jgi:hypothetical protein
MALAVVNQVGGFGEVERVAQRPQMTRIRRTTPITPMMQEVTTVAVPGEMVVVEAIRRQVWQR